MFSAPRRVSKWTPVDSHDVILFIPSKRLSPQKRLVYFADSIGLSLKRLWSNARKASLSNLHSIALQLTKHCSVTYKALLYTLESIAFIPYKA